jgi:hypothetical protein
VSEWEDYEEPLPTSDDLMIDRMVDEFFAKADKELAECQALTEQF